MYSQEIGADNVVTLDLEAGAARLFILPEGYDFSERRKWTPVANENIALKAQVYCDTSVGESGWYMSNLNDGKRFSSSSSNGWMASDKAESAVIVMDLGQEAYFNRIDIYPAGDLFEYGSSMPSSFAISVSADGENWYKLASAENFTIQNFTVPSIRFTTIKARFIRLVVNKFNGEKLQLAEIEVYYDGGDVGEPESILTNSSEERGLKEVKYKKGSNIARDKSVTVSSYPSEGGYKSWGWWPDYLVDGDYTRGWTSNVKIHMNSGNCTEYAIIDLDDVFAISRIEVTPLGCWPKDFEIQLSKDRENWVTVASEKNSKKPEDTYNVELNGNDPYRYVMFKGTKLTNTSADGYMLQLAEISVWGAPYKDAAEAEQLMNEFIAAGGNESDELYVNVRTLLVDPDATQSKLDVAMKAMLESVGKELPDVKKQNAEPVNYAFNIEPNPLETVDDTVVPTVRPGNVEDEPEQKSRNSAAAAVIAGIAVGAAAIAGTAFIVAKKKKKKQSVEAEQVDDNG